MTLNKVKKKIKRARPKKWNRNPSGYGGSWVVLEFAELGEYVEYMEYVVPISFPRWVLSSEP